MSQLNQKYNRPAPRYTSYPAVPHWKTADFSEYYWKKKLTTAYRESKYSAEGISLYIHLPFCESLCTFCGCNKHITKNHSNEDPYINALLKEWELYLRLFEEKPLIKEIHLGGGTPTFFSTKNLVFLIENILSKSGFSSKTDFSFEGHPNNTTVEHLNTLKNLGFTRVSFGVQDYNETVQKAIHRIQPFENVQRVTDAARNAGYTSIGHDIIYGLPFQNEEHIQYTFQKTNELKPDRIAFYSYAHVPWLKGNGQRGFQEENIPAGEAKRNLYDTGKKLLSTNGYTEIGMDHFALPHDALYQSMKNQTLHRNFMGYTPHYSSILIGLGVSSISSCETAFAQNEKKLADYYRIIQQEKLPVVKGHLLSQEDRQIGKIIRHLTCRFTAKIDVSAFEKERLLRIFEQLESFQKDKLITLQNHTISISEKGKPYIRYICMAFDAYQSNQQTTQQQFSMTI